MTARYLLDTNICIAVMKRRPQELLERMNVAADVLAVSAITEAELHFGVAKSMRPQQNGLILANFLARLAVLPFGDTAPWHYGEIREFLERAGTPIGANDLLIAAHARSLGAVLVTNNRREFDRVPELTVEDWL